MVKKDTKKSIIKPVSFTQNNETDLEIIKFIEDNKLAFSTYVKDLITKDIRKEKEKNKIADAINNLTNVIANAISNNNFNIACNHIENTEDEDIVDEEQKNIIGNILNMSK